MYQNNKVYVIPLTRSVLKGQGRHNFFKVVIYCFKVVYYCVVVGKHDMQSRLDGAMQDVTDKYLILEEQEKRTLRKALIEERGRFCLFVSCMKPFVVSIL